MVQLRNAPEDPFQGAYKSSEHVAVKDEGDLEVEGGEEGILAWSSNNVFSDYAELEDDVDD